MRRLPTIAALTLILDCVGTAPVAGAPVCFPCGPSTAITVRREGVVVLARGGMGGGGGGTHCGPSCGGGRGGMGGAGGGMGGLGGGMGGFQGWDPFLRVPRANCVEDRSKPAHRHTRTSPQCADSR
jgi:hypothetical protein